MMQSHQRLSQYKIQNYENKIIQEYRIKVEHTICELKCYKIKVITKLPNSEQSYKGKVQTHNYINRQNQSTTGKVRLFGVR
jgi:hypothetical protein